MFSEIRKRAKKSGQPPGTAIYTGKKKDIKPVVTAVQYTARDAKTATGPDLKTALPERLPHTELWLAIEGLNDSALIEDIKNQFKLHPLTVEDILNVEQRPKVEEFEQYLFMTLKVITWHDQSSTFHIHQLSMVVGDHFILSFIDKPSTRFDALRERLLKTPNQRLREQGCDYLAYRLIDMVVDEYFVVLEALGDQIETVEQRIIASPKPKTARTIYRLKRQMLVLRKAVWPMREAISHLLYIENTLITKFTRVYLRDVYDHTVQAIDSMETFRDMLSGMLDMYLSSLTIRMNEIMKTLTIITTIFIPITALSSIYGMNLPDVPFMQSHYGFELVFAAMISIAVIMLLYFRKKKWI